MKAKRMSIALTPHMEELIEKAERILHKDAPNDTRWRCWVAHWAVLAVFREICAREEMPCPLGVELRDETPEESQARCGIYCLGSEHPHRGRFKWTPDDDGMAGKE